MRDIARVSRVPERFLNSHHWLGQGHAALVVSVGKVDARASFLIEIPDLTATPIELGSARRRAAHAAWC